MLQTFERFIDLYLYFARSFGDVIFAGSNSEPMAFEHGGIFKNAFCVTSCGYEGCHYCWRKSISRVL